MPIKSVFVRSSLSANDLPLCLKTLSIGTHSRGLPLLTRLNVSVLTSTKLLLSDNTEVRVLSRKLIIYL
jgi:hypothetical protein